jgi:hypothetical protein
MKAFESIYDPEKREGRIVFPNGRELKVGNVTREKFEAFAERNGEEFARRDCVLTTEGTVLRREA